MGDYNIDLLKYDTRSGYSDFLDFMYANFLLPYISAASRVTLHSKTLIKNIFSNMIEYVPILGSLETVISDHYGQCLLMKKLSSKNDCKYRSLSSGLLKD